MHYIPEPPVKEPENEFLIGSTPASVALPQTTCPRAQTLQAYSLTFGCECLLTLPCKTWGCRVCSVQKIKALSLAVQAAKPNRLLTLTIDPALHLSPAEAWKTTRKKVPLLVRKLRTKFGEVEYLRVTEVTKAGWPHYHLLVRSGYLPHSVVKSIWSEMTGARIVDLRQVLKSFSAYKYLVKYLSKLHKLEWTERHVSLSRGFAPKSAYDPEIKLDLAEKSFVNEHPSSVLARDYHGYWAKRLTNNVLLITPEEPIHVRNDRDHRFV